MCPQECMQIRDKEPIRFQCPGRSEMMHAVTVLGFLTATGVQERALVSGRSQDPYL